MSSVDDGERPAAAPKLVLTPLGEGWLLVRDETGAVVSQGPHAEVYDELRVRYGAALTEMLATSELALPDWGKEIRGVQVFVSNRDTGEFKKVKL